MRRIGKDIMFSHINLLSFLAKYQQRGFKLLRVLAQSNPRDWKGSETSSVLVDAGFDAEMIRYLLGEVSDGQLLAAYHRWIEKGIRCVSCFDGEYPAMLRTLPDLPVVLFYSGNLSVVNQRAVSIVGARHADRKGIEVSETFAAALARSGFCIISGLALGIDGAAHRGALRMRNESTAAILGNGIESCYPPAHQMLFEDILQKGGCIISEYFPGTPAYPGNFLERNRIIAGLGSLLLVVQAAKRSGSLRTAHAALEYGRDVAAVPWDIGNARGEGCNRLLQRGALVVTSPDDILEYFGIRSSADTAQVVEPLSDGEAAVLDVLADEGDLHIDELKKRTFATELEIVNLELQGLIARSYSNIISRSLGKLT